MTFNNFCALCLGIFFISSCNSGGGGGAVSACTTATQNDDPDLIVESSTNVIPVHVADSSTTGDYGYINEPLVAVKICSPGHTQESECQVIRNILLDTGSFGLRVFKSAINSNVELTSNTVSVPSFGTYDLAQCAIFGTGATWGPIKKADVLLGNQSAINTPIQVIDRDYAFIPSSCASLADTDPCSSGFNGILGLGLFKEDCGADCASTSTSVNPGLYFACDDAECFNAYRVCPGSGCINKVAVALNLQVLNPLANFAANFNNGVSITLPSVAAGGASAVQGTLTLGIGAAAGNDPSGNASIVAMDAGPTGYANFLTQFTSDANRIFGDNPDSSLGDTAFIDSGSNGIFFDTTLVSLPDCTSGFFCPSSTQALSATMKGFSTGIPTVVFLFSIGNADTLFSSGNSAFSNVGGSFSDLFDWGLPAYFGKTIYHGLDGEDAVFNPSATKTGPYWALQ
jgi:hypothetical protein